MGEADWVRTEHTAGSFLVVMTFLIHLQVVVIIGSFKFSAKPELSESPPHSASGPVVPPAFPYRCLLLPAHPLCCPLTSQGSPLSPWLFQRPSFCGIFQAGVRFHIERQRMWSQTPSLVEYWHATCFVSFRKENVSHAVASSSWNSLSHSSWARSILIAFMFTILTHVICM